MTGGSKKEEVESDMDELIDPLPGKLRKTVVSVCQTGQSS